jgi:hypothetical protein
MLTADTWRAWMANPWACWGVGPIVVLAIGFIATALPLEWLIRQSFMSKYLITYDGDSKKGDGGRPAAVDRTQQTVPLKEQINGATLTLAGPTAILGGILSAVVMPFVVKAFDDDTPLLPNLTTFVGMIIAMK